MRNEQIGILLMAYGTPESPEEVEPYLTHIREHYTYIRGDKRPSPEMVADLQARYRLIGGRSPLLAITRAQAAALEERLNAEAGARFRAYVGMKHWHPFIHDAVARMAADGIRRAVGIALTPQYSRLSVGGYIHAAQEAVQQTGAGIAMSFVEHWHQRPAFLDALARRVEKARTLFPEEQRQDLPVVFTAHSLPARIREWNDPYPRHLEETARGVAQRAGIRRWFVAWQSAGSTPVAWLEPELPEVLSRLREGGDRAVLICPAGFVADHLEVLYDLDIEARKLAAEMGMQLERTASFNADSDLIDVLAELVLEQVAEATR